MTTLAIPRPQDIATVEQVAEYASAVEAFAQDCDDLPTLNDIKARWAAVSAFVRQKGREGTARTEAAARVIEARIGVVVRDAEAAGLIPRHGQHAQEFQGCNSSFLGIEPRDRADYVAMADYPEVVADVIAESTDAAPATRNKVRTAIRDAKAAEENAKSRKAAETAYTRRDLPVPTKSEVQQQQRADELLGRVMVTLDDVIALGDDIERLHAEPVMSAPDVQQRIREAQSVLQRLETT